MIAALLEVHHHVEEGHLVPAPAGVQRLKVTRQDELVVFPGKQEKIYRFQFLNVSQPESVFKIQTIRLLRTDLLNHKYLQFIFKHSLLYFIYCQLRAITIQWSINLCLIINGASQSHDIIREKRIPDCLSPVC